MAESNTAKLACRECGTELSRKRPNGRAPELCGSCRSVVNRATARAAYLRRRSAERAPTDYICAACKGQFRRRSQMGSPPERCPECVAERARWWSKRQAQNYVRLTRERYEREGRWTTCVACKDQIKCNRMGPLPKWCESCFRQRKANFDQTRRRGVRNQESFAPREIFERDRWKCGICQKRINSKLKHPHPMSASLDHVIPLSEGGSHTRANTRASHLRCNIRRRHMGGGEQLALIG